MRDPVSSNGRCVVDGKRLGAIAVSEGDPFCSTECCQKYHAVQHMGGEPRPRSNARRRG